MAPPETAQQIMDKSQDPEAAETVQTTDSPAVVHERLVRLLARFRGFISARRETAERWREKGEPRVASSSDRAADFFERCAEELERTINGEMPPDPGHAWPICETNGRDGVGGSSFPYVTAQTLLDDSAKNL